MNDKTINLRPLWDALLDVYKVFSEICERHGLRYCADTGTALGAVRHRGFIPWDDDMDFQMPRPDYDKFVKIAKVELPAGYTWIDRFNCPGFELPFGKIVVTDEDRIKQVSGEFGSPLEDGLFIDIFPLDGYPDSHIMVWLRRLQEYIINCNWRYYRGLGQCRRWQSKLAWLAGALFWKYNIRSMKDKSDYYEKRARKYIFGETVRCVSIGLAASWDDKPYPVSYFGHPRLMPFENLYVPVQENVHGYLKEMFGDYMKFPPEKDRHSTHDHTKIAPWRH